MVPAANPAPEGSAYPKNVPLVFLSIVKPVVIFEVASNEPPSAYNLSPGLICELVEGESEDFAVQVSENDPARSNEGVLFTTFAAVSTATAGSVPIKTGWFAVMVERHNAGCRRLVGAAE